MIQNYMYCNIPCFSMSNTPSQSYLNYFGLTRQALVSIRRPVRVVERPLACRIWMVFTTFPALSPCTMDHFFEFWGLVRLDGPRSLIGAHWRGLFVRL